MQPTFPESPVAGGDMLAYSCAAARDLHPLPILARADKDTRIVNVEKELEQRGANDSGRRRRSQIGSLLSRRLQH
jgi:hypothetical protein